MGEKNVYCERSHYKRRSVRQNDITKMLKCLGNSNLTKNSNNNEPEIFSFSAIAAKSLEKQKI